MNNILELPLDCLAQILSLTSPRDVLRSSAVSKQLLAMSAFDTVWDKFIPSNCMDFISLHIPPQIVSKKDQFMHLCDFPILFDNSVKSFVLDKSSGKIRCMLGSRALSIEWAVDTPHYWSWEAIPESRFPECAVLNQVSWVNIHGSISTTLLSRGTTYGAYFVFKMDANITGYYKPVLMSVSVISEDGSPIVNYVVETKSVNFRAPGELFIARDDGWMEIEMGRYQVGVNGESVQMVMTVWEHQCEYWKNGLVVDGIEIRPLS